MKQVRQIGRRAAAVLIAAALCAALCVTGLALSPTLRENLTAVLGNFEPYSKTIEGAVCTDQGIEIQVLSALADDVRGKLYISVRDVEGDRLDEFVKLIGKLEIAEDRDPTEEELKENGVTWSPASSNFSFVSYNPENKTALLVSTFKYGTYGHPVETATLTASSVTTTQGKMNASVSADVIPAGTLESLPLGPDDNMFFTPSDVGNLGYNNSCLPWEQVVLAPDQNPMPMAGTEDMWISSIGFASDGCLHVRLAFAEGVDFPHMEHKSLFFADLTLKEGVERDAKYHTIAETEVAGGIDILFPLIHPEDLACLDAVRLSGSYTRPGANIEGHWLIKFPFEYMPSRTLVWTGELAGRQVTQVTVSPMTVTIDSNDRGGIASQDIYAVLQDGTTISGKPSTGGYNNVGANGKEIWVAHNTWEFEDPVDLEQVTALELLGERIPVEWAS